MLQCVNSGIGNLPLLEIPIRESLALMIMRKKLDALFKNIMEIYRKDL